MKQYSEIVINALPLMLSQETKGKVAVTIASYMNGMLRSIKTEEDIRIFAETLQSCKIFAAQNGLNGLTRTCIEWNHEGIQKLDSIRGVKQQESAQKLANQIVQKLSQLQGIINQVSNIDTDVLDTVSPQLDQIEMIIQMHGTQLFQPQQLEIIRREIAQQREGLRVKNAMIDDILDENHIPRI